MLAKAETVWDRCDGEADTRALDAYIFGWLRMSAMSVGAVLRKREQRNGFYRDEGGEDEEGTYAPPTTFVRPEQEDAVFWKQMIERCERLPEHERDLARLIFDRATAWEMAQELGISTRDVLRETMQLVRQLDDEPARSSAG